jgi:hypothetical protein
LIIDDEALIPYLGKGMVSELVWSGIEKQSAFCMKYGSIMPRI